MNRPFIFLFKRILNDESSYLSYHIQDYPYAHETQIEELVQNLSKSEGLNSETIHESAEETVQKASEMMETYLGEDPDSSEALDFLCLAEGGEVSHYEVLSAMTRGVKDSQFAGTVQSILEEEKRHLQTCIQLAKQNAASEQ